MASPIESAVNAWSKRTSLMDQAGIKPASYQEIAKRDIDAVKRGGVGMTDTEAALAIRAGLGTPTIKVERGTRPQDILGNVAPDIEDIVRNFVPGVIKLAAGLPGDVVNYVTGGDKERYGHEPQTDFGALTRNVARSPLINLLPGSFAAANVSTPEGRDYMKQHPVMSVLDVLPFVAKAGKVATAGRVAAPGSAIEALQKGNPFRAGLRATTDITGKIPGTRGYLGRQFWNESAANLGISEPIRETLSRPYAQLQRRADKEAKKFIESEIAPIFAEMDEASRVALTEYGARRKTGMDPADRNPEYEAILSKVDEVNERLLQEGELAGGVKRLWLPGIEKPVVYSTESPVLRAHYRVQRAEEMVGRVNQRVSNAVKVAAEWGEKLEPRQGKIRGFMEKEDQFNTRQPGPVGPEVVRQAARPMIESFQHLDPMKVFSEYLDKIYSGTVKKQTATYLRRDFDKLQGEGGLFAKFDEAMAAGDIKAASKYMTETNRILRNKAWDDFDTTTRIRRHVADIRSELIGLRKRTKSFEFANRMVNKAHERIARYDQMLLQNQDRLRTRQAEFQEQLINNPPATFKPLLIDLVRSKSTDAARQMFQGEQLDAAIKRIQTSPLMREIADLVGQNQFRQIWQGTIRSWVDLAREGYDPIWLHHVPTSRFDSILKPRLLPDAEIHPGQWRDVTMNFGPGVSDIAVGLSAAAAELTARKFTSQFISDYVMKWARTKEDVLKELDETVRNSTANIRPSFGIEGEVAKLLQRSWRDFDPAKYGMKHVTTTRNNLVVPVGVDRSLNAFTRGFQYVPIRGVWDKAMKVYKYSVLMGPKQFSDVVFGGMLTVALREPAAIFKMREAVRMWKMNELPDEFMHEFYDMGTDQLWNFKAGQTMGRHLIEKLGSAPRALARMEETVSAWQRTAVYLSASERAAKKGGLSPTLAREAGLQQAYKTLVDFDGMSWLERSVVRQAIPFYSFMRYLMKYVLSYPVDHPIRAAILSRFAEIEMRDQQDGLAEKYQNYFRLGDTDEKGNVKIVDYRSANPFQSFANNFTLGGLLSAINPVVTSAFEAAGLNTLTATPDLYPDMAYDEETGSLTAKRGNVPLTIAGNFIPQIEGADAFLTITDKMKRLKERNPEAYKRQLYTHLHLPFAGIEGVIPGVKGLTVNIPYERSKAELGRYRAAREELSQATQKDDFTAVNRYNLVPYQGKLVDPVTIERLWSIINGRLADRGVEGVNPRALIPRS